MRYCKKCGCEIKNEALGNRIKFVGKENKAQWISRHIRQLFSLILNGFAKPEIEGYIELCDRCYLKFQDWLSGGES